MGAKFARLVQTSPGPFAESPNIPFDQKRWACIISLCYTSLAMGDTEEDLQPSSSGSFDNKKSSREGRPSFGPIGASTTVTRV